jgi:hypothetical protein
MSRPVSNRNGAQLRLRGRREQTQCRLELSPPVLTHHDQLSCQERPNRSVTAPNSLLKP